MNVTSSWHKVHFHDAVVRSVEQSAEAVVFHLEDFFVDAKHPDRQRGKQICLPKGSLIFKQVHSVLVRVYDSDTNNWQTLSRTGSISEGASHLCSEYRSLGVCTLLMRVRELTIEIGATMK